MTDSICSPTPQTFQGRSKSESAGDFEHAYDGAIAEILEGLGLSLFVTTYQAGKLIVMRARGGKLHTLLRSFEQPMGLAIGEKQMALGTQNQIWYFRNEPSIASQLEPAGRYDACYVPRSSHVTGDIRVHEIGWKQDELWLVNTRFSCLCTISPDFSFVPRWRPPFISMLAAEDRCHLNGMALDSSGPRFVTALGATDSLGGWRENKITGGCVIDVPSGQVVLRELCMPHSPRLHEGKLWLLDSGRGRLLLSDPASGRFEVIAQVPGYARGLAIAGNFAFIGLSQIRETAVFGGLPIANSGKELKCGVWVVDLNRGQVAGCVEFRKGVFEIFDVKLVGSCTFPTVLGFQKPTVHGVFIIPPDVFRSSSPVPENSQTAKMSKSADWG